VDHKFSAAISLQEASSTSDVSTLTPDAAGGAGFDSPPAAPRFRQATAPGPRLYRA
jgi:hypothetical protein